MLKILGEKLADGRWHAAAAERNKAPIGSVLERVLPARGEVLEVASGTGQHVAYFARLMRGLVWQPSDPDAELCRAIELRLGEEGLDNVRAPLELDVRREPWPVGRADAVLCINMIHVAPWEATGALMRGAGRVLAAGVLYLYGPYRRHGRHTAPSNAAFDERLRSENPDWGLRDAEAVADAAARCGLALEETIEMPANNLSLVFRKAA